MATGKAKEPLRREHMTDAEWARFGKMCECILKMKRKDAVAEARKVTHPEGTEGSCS